MSCVHPRARTGKSDVNPIIRSSIQVIASIIQQGLYDRVKENTVLPSLSSLEEKDRKGVDGCFQVQPTAGKPHFDSGSLVPSQPIRRFAMSFT